MKHFAEQSERFCPLPPFVARAHRRRIADHVGLVARRSHFRQERERPGPAAALGAGRNRGAVGNEVGLQAGLLHGVEQSEGALPVPAARARRYGAVETHAVRLFLFFFCETKLRSTREKDESRRKHAGIREKGIRRCK